MTVAGVLHSQGLRLEENSTKVLGSSFLSPLSSRSLSVAARKARVPAVTLQQQGSGRNNSLIVRDVVSTKKRDGFASISDDDYAENFRPGFTLPIFLRYSCLTFYVLCKNQFSRQPNGQSLQQRLWKNICSRRRPRTSQGLQGLGLDQTSTSAQQRSTQLSSLVEDFAELSDLTQLLRKPRKLSVLAYIEATSAYNGVGIVKLMGRQSGVIAMLASLASGQVTKHFKGIGMPADVKYIDPTYMIRACRANDPTYMIRACRANASDRILCAVLGQNAVCFCLQEDS